MSDLPWLSRINPQVQTAGHAQWPPLMVEAPRIIYNHELVVFTGGTCRVEIAGVVYTCKNKTFLIVPPDVEHVTMNGDEAVHRYWVHFDWVLDRRMHDGQFCVIPPKRPKRHLVRLAPAFVPRRVQHGPIPEPARVLALLRDLSLRWNTGDALGRATCRALLLEILILLFGETAGKAPDRHTRLAFEAKAALDGVAMGGGSVQARLASLGYSYEHVCRLFRSQFGVSPIAYVNAVRIARARRLLADPQLSVAQVAFEAGFSDASYFTRVFRRCVGVCPSRYLYESSVKP